MTTRAPWVWAVAIAAVACGGSDGSGADTGSQGGSDAAGPDDDGASADSTGSSGGTGTTWPPGDTAGLGETCTWHDDCVSWYCRRFSDVPPDPDAACAETPPSGTVVVTGTIHDLRTGDVVGDASVRVVSAVAAVANPVEADALVETTADADGRVETSSDLVDGTPLGILASVQKDGYALTFTALAGPITDDGTDYFPGNDIHDLWAVAEADAGTWSQMLASDPLITDFLPLVEKGGAIGIVRDAETGAPISGAVVQSEKGIDSAAYVRYLDDAGEAFGSEATGASGIFVIVNAAVAESFAAFVGDEEIGSAVAGSAAGSILAVSIH